MQETRSIQQKKTKVFWTFWKWKRLKKMFCRKAKSLKIENCKEKGRLDINPFIFGV
jgi:hypothetical protein